jgi:endonuclease/exonuclease/phosphatase family metal-dependent hydrolase
MSVVYSKEVSARKFGVSWNIDTNLARLEGNPLFKECFPQWAIARRMPAIFAKLDEEDPDWICLQELRNCALDNGDRVDSETPLVEHLESKGYRVIVTSYNNSGGDRAFKYLTAFKESTFEFIETSALHFTETPAVALDRTGKTDEEILSHNFGAFFERCAAIVKLRLKESGKVINIVNVHLDIPLRVRMKSVRILNDYMQELEIAGEDFIAMGDFNAFPDWGGAEQLAVIKYPDAVDAASTFIAFPYDWGKADRVLKVEGLYEELKEIENCDERRERMLNIYEERCDALGGALDHVFHSGLNSLKADIVLTCDDDGIDLDEAIIKEYVMKCAHAGEPAFASDHQLIRISFTE